MSVRIEMPQLSSEGESATLATWLVAVGDDVVAGDVIAELETDKATVELEAPIGGTIAELSLVEGTEAIAPGSLLGTIEPGDGLSAEVGPAAASRPSELAPSAGSDSEGPAAGSEAAETQGPRSTPLARRAAVANEVDLGAIPGSGPGGRIVEADVLRVMDGGASPAEEAKPSPLAPPAPGPPPSLAEPAGDGFQTTRLSAMRKTIARRMTESKQQVPHFYLRIRASMDAVIAARARLNAGLLEEGRGIKISVNDFILRASALALRDVPEANVQFAGRVMHVFDRIDVSVAVATEGGLVTPIVRDADRKGLAVLAEEVKSLALQAREGSLMPDQYQGGTFTISNLGMYGIDTVYPILNPPQACILGVGAAEEQPVVRDGEIGVGRVASLTLAADHRVVDGAVGARLLSSLRDRLEDPMGMML
ncbi:MAG: 2-oxo acid dehydrogenase subunit E2 [bacterium]|nr:2-oxo acid dehydrogenase subunit E2 [bacterium]